MNRYRAIPLAHPARRPAILAMLGLLLVLVAPVAAQEPALPSGDALLDKYFEAVGGMSVMKELETRHATGTIEAPAMGMKGTIESYQQAPDLQRNHVEIADMMTADEGTDGTVAWANDSMQGPRIKEGEEGAVARRRALFPEYRMRAEYDSVETVGVENVGDRKCYKMVLTPKVGHAETWYVDADSYLLVKMETVEPGPMGEVPVSITLNDYQKTGGLLVARSTTMSMGPVEMTFTLDTIEHNVAIPAGTFDLPEEVKALLEEAPAEDQAAPAEGAMAPADKTAAPEGEKPPEGGQ